MSVVGVVVSWDFDALVWSCLLCDLRVVYCVWCVMYCVGMCGFGVVIIVICMASTCEYIFGISGKFERMR